MIDRELLPAAALACKANLHWHTTFSDGKLTTEQIRDAYRRQGYSVVAFTDHRHYGWYPELETEDFVPLAGFDLPYTALLDAGMATPAVELSFFFVPRESMIS